MDSRIGLARPHQHGIAHPWLQMLGLTIFSTIFSGRFRGNARYQRGHSALFSGYSLPEHICAVF